MRMIDADKLIDTLKESLCEPCNNYGGILCRTCKTGDAINRIDEQPTVKAVPFDDLRAMALTCQSNHEDSIAEYLKDILREYDNE